MTSQTSLKRIDIWHNILWSQYKGEVFSSLYKINDAREFDIRFFQIAETEDNRVGLGAVDWSRHRYPFHLLFKGAYERIRLIERVRTVACLTLKSNADLVILTGYEKLEGWAQLLILLSKRKKIAIFCDSTIHDRKQSFLRGLLKSFFFKTVNGIFGYGERSRDYVLHYGADRKKVYYRCQAAALPHDYTPESALSERLAEAPSSSEPRFLYVGRLSAEKNLDTLINAFVLVKNRHPDASLELVGQGNERESLETRVQALGLSASIHFAGSKSGGDLYKSYARSTILVLPSTSEPWGLVVNEALASGCPAIVSHVCGCAPELIKNGKTGFVFDAGNATELAEKMLTAITQFSDIEKTARHCITLMKDYTPDKAAREILTGCRDILSERWL